MAKGSRTGPCQGCNHVEHVRIERCFYTPACLLCDFEAALASSTCRVRHLADIDADFNYAIGPEAHSAGSYSAMSRVQSR